MRRSALVLLGVGLLLSLGGWWSRRPPAWLSEDPLLHPFGLAAGESESSAAAPREIPDQPPPDPDHPIHLPDADLRELQRLPGVGAVLAARMIAQRDSLGGLGSIEQLDAVPGIGPKLLARLIPLIRFTSAKSDSLRDP